MIVDSLSAVPAYFGFGAEPVEEILPNPYLVVYYPELFDEEYPEEPLYRAFGNYGEAKRFFEWQRIIGEEHAALYDFQLNRLEQGETIDPTFGYFLFDRFVNYALPEDAWDIFTVDPDAPYLVGMWYHGMPTGHVVADLESAIEAFRDEIINEPGFIVSHNNKEIAHKNKRMTDRQRIAVEEFVANEFARFTAINEMYGLELASPFIAPAKQEALNDAHRIAS